MIDDTDEIASFAQTPWEGKMADQKLTETSISVQEQQDWPGADFYGKDRGVPNA
jgi:hypothetical protein